MISHNLALGHDTSASSGRDSGNAVDNNINTSWSSNASNVAEWWGVDLGASYDISRVRLFWGTGHYASGYDIQVSNDPTFTTYTTIYSTTTAIGGIDDLSSVVLSPGSGRFFRVYMTSHLPSTAVTLNEVEVYGPYSAAQPTVTVIPSPTPTVT